jgi:hypothetical protein
MQALVRRGGQLLCSELPLLSRAAASAAATSASTSASGKPALNKEFLVYRWDPEQGGAPSYQTYKVDLNS